MSKKGKPPQQAPCAQQLQVNVACNVHLAGQHAKKGNKMASAYYACAALMEAALLADAVRNQ